MEHVPRNAIIVGFARSGTSMAAGVFARNGYHATPDGAEDLVPTDWTNPMGYWESRNLIGRNVEVLRAAGYAFHNSWAWEPIAEIQINRIAQLTPLAGHREFIDHYARASPWVWKDPRLCLTLQYWWKILPRDRTAVVLLTRDANEIYRSFRRVQFVPAQQESRERVEALIAQHLRVARKTIEEMEIPHIELDHSMFFGDPGRLAADLGAFFGLDLGPEDLHVRTDLNHSTLAGRIRTALIAGYMRLPSPVRQFVKRMTPPGIAARVAPESKYID